MKKHNFNFDGGEHLTKMGATWFVSYSYYSFIDTTHDNWKKIKTYKYRISIFNNTKNYHKYWLEKILDMEDDKLNTNEIGLDALKTKEMIKILLDRNN